MDIVTSRQITRRQLEAEFQRLKERIYELVTTPPGFLGTTIDFGEKLGYDNDDLLSAALADLEYEGKIERPKSKTVFREDGGAIILGIYGIQKRQK